MNKRTVPIGKKFGRLTVIGASESDKHGNQLVRVRCDCPRRTEKTIRLCALTAKEYTDRSGKLRRPVRSCGCESRVAYVEFLDRRAKGFNKRFRRLIYKSHQGGATFQEIGRMFRNVVPPEVISAIIRGFHAERRGRRRY